MFLETFFQDIRVGARMLIKEKSCCLLTVFAVISGLVPALRATRVDPMVALRSE